MRGYLDALREAGYQDNAMIRGNEFSIQNGYIETKLALNSTTKPTAIFTLSSTILLGAVKALNEHKSENSSRYVYHISFDDNLYLDYLNLLLLVYCTITGEYWHYCLKMLMQKILGRN